MIPFGTGRGRARGTRRDRRHLRGDGLPRACRRRARPSERACRSRSSTCARCRPSTGTRSRPSVRKTSKVLVLTEDSLSWGYGAEIARADRREHLHRARRPGAPSRGDRHLRRLRPELEDFILPQVADIVRAVEELAAW
jgi:hypothetical protein